MGPLSFLSVGKSHPEDPNALPSELSSQCFQHLTGLASGDCTPNLSYLLPAEATLELEAWGSWLR